MTGRLLDAELLDSVAQHPERQAEHLGAAVLFNEFALPPPALDLLELRAEQRGAVGMPTSF